MKFYFTDSGKTRYGFELYDRPDIKEDYVEITVSYSPTGSSVTARPIVNGKVQWSQLDDRRVSSEAKQYLDKAIKNKAFL